MFYTRRRAYIVYPSTIVLNQLWQSWFYWPTLHLAGLTIAGVQSWFDISANWNRSLARARRVLSCKVLQGVNHTRWSLCWSKHNCHSHLTNKNPTISTIVTMASNLQSQSCGAIHPYVLLSTYRLLVSRVCGLASVADEVATHLRTRHRDIQPEHRQGLVEKINQNLNIIRS